MVRAIQNSSGEIRGFYGDNNTIVFQTKQEDQQEIFRMSNTRDIDGITLSDDNAIQVEYKNGTEAGFEFDGYDTEAEQRHNITHTENGVTHEPNPFGEPAPQELYTMNPERDEFFATLDNGDKVNFSGGNVSYNGNDYEINETELDQSYIDGMIGMEGRTFLSTGDTEFGSIIKTNDETYLIQELGDTRRAYVLEAAEEATEPETTPEEPVEPAETETVPQTAPVEPNEATDEAEPAEDEAVTITDNPSGSSEFSASIEDLSEQVAALVEALQGLNTTQTPAETSSATASSGAPAPASTTPIAPATAQVYNNPLELANTLNDLSLQLMQGPNQVSEEEMQGLLADDTTAGLENPESLALALEQMANGQNPAPTTEDDSAASETEAPGETTETTPEANTPAATGDDTITPPAGEERTPAAEGEPTENQVRIAQMFDIPVVLGQNAEMQGENLVVTEEVGDNKKVTIIRPDGSRTEIESRNRIYIERGLSSLAGTLEAGTGIAATILTGGWGGIIGASLAADGLDRMGGALNPNNKHFIVTEYAPDGETALARETRIGDRNSESGRRRIGTTLVTGLWRAFTNGFEGAATETEIQRAYDRERNPNDF